MGEMRIIDGTGDTKLIWDKNNQAEVDNARKTFNDLVKNKKFAAFSVKKSGDKKDQVYKFSPNAEKLIMVPQIQGG
ncbi:MAG: hypothetical protein ACYSW3_01895 [Planctomycetota bacterium]|jgi:hypothetical protein